MWFVVDFEGFLQAMSFLFWADPFIPFVDISLILYPFSC